MNKNYTFYYMSKIRKKSQRFIEDRLAENGLSGLCASHGTILSILYSEGKALAMTDISRRISRNKSTTSQLVNKLVDLGYAKRTQCKTDRRINFVSLTEKGRDIEPAFNSISGKLIENAYRNFSDDETEELLRLLKKLSDNFTD